MNSATATSPGLHRCPPPRVLCVDDNRDAADSGALLLGVSGFEARACYGGRAALAEAAEFLPAVCVIDLNMPGMDGDELAALLLARAAAPVALVALTARSDDESRRRIRRAGFGAHLVKPADPAELLAAVRAALGRAAGPDRPR